MNLMLLQDELIVIYYVINLKSFIYIYQLYKTNERI